MSLQVRVQKRRDGLVLDVDLGIGSGITALLGPSGAGKSTLLNLVAGLEKPDSGRIVAGGQVFFDSHARPPVDLPPHRRRVGYVFQQPALFPHLDVWANITYGANGRAYMATRVPELLRLLRLEGLEHRRVRELSGGQQQRVALARTLMANPRLLLMDEPFSALDNLIRQRLRRDLLAVREVFSAPTLFVTHDLEEAFSLGERVAVMDQGRILQYGPREEVYYRPACRRVARFVGMRNIFDARVVAADSHGLRLQGPKIDVLVTPGEGVVPAAGLAEGAGRGETVTEESGPGPGGAANPVSRASQVGPQGGRRAGEGPGAWPRSPQRIFPVGTNVAVAVRPEEITLAGGRQGPNMIAGVIVQVILEGAMHRLLVRFTHDAYDLEVLLPFRTCLENGLAVGSRAAFYLDPRALHILSE